MDETRSKQDIRVRFSGLFLSLLLLFVGAANSLAAPVEFIDEAEFLDALAALGLEAVHEGFEDDATWGHVRSVVVGEFPTAPSVTSLGLKWTANNLSSGITTGTGPALTGLYGFFSYLHGSYGNPDPGTDCLIPGDCGDGFRGRVANGMLYAVGGWVETNTPFAKLGMFLGDYPDNPVDFGETCDPPDSENCSGNAIIGNTPKFFGVIDEVGFELFEYRELEGKLEIDGGDIKLIFADDFYFVIGDPDRVFKDGFE